MPVSTPRELPGILLRATSFQGRTLSAPWPLEALSPLSPGVTSCRGGRGGPRFAAIEDEYSGPKLEDGKVTLAFMKELMQWYKEQKKLHRKCAYQVPQFSQNSPPIAPRWGRPRPLSATCPPLCPPLPCCPFAPADPGAGEGGAGQAAHLGRNDAEGGGCPSPGAGTAGWGGPAEGGRPPPTLWVVTFGPKRRRRR